MMKMPSWGRTSGSMNAMLGSATSTSFDLRYLSFTLDPRVGERWRAHVLDILVIVVENQEERTSRLKIRDERLDALLERRLVDFLTPTECKELLARSRRTHADERKSMYFSVIWDERVGIILVFLDDKMALFFDLLIVLPADGAPPELGEKVMIPIPRLKVEGTPDAAFLGPKGAHTLEYVAACIEGRIDTLETLVVFLDLLWGDQTGQEHTRARRTGLEGLAEVLFGAKVDGGHVPETRFCEETVGVGQRDGVLCELHCVQPVSYVLDLGRGEEETGLKVLEGAHVELYALDAIPVDGVVWVHEGVLGKDGLERAAIEWIREGLVPVRCCERRGRRR